MYIKWWKIASINSVNFGKIRTDGSMEGSIEELSVGKVTVDVSAGKASTSWEKLGHFCWAERKRFGQLLAWRS